MKRHRLVVLHLTDPSVMTGKRECHITCSCGWASLFVNRDNKEYEVESHAKTHFSASIKEI